MTTRQTWTLVHSAIHNQFPTESFTTLTRQLLVDNISIPFAWNACPLLAVHLYMLRTFQAAPYATRPSQTAIPTDPKAYCRCVDKQLLVYHDFGGFLAVMGMMGTGASRRMCFYWGGRSQA
ncbi:hypothetical protein VKT23_014761 [Stygiomarasmius scandens]|uniref:Uncharacterized protein n=1 Tax=Marasmiellus scandens TaxID=2682957 RepID=A0ABR1IZS0_9AGAR